MQLIIAFVCFVIQIADHLGDYDAAWLYLDEFHDVQRERAVPYNKESISQQTASIKAAFKPEFWPSPSSGIGLQTTYPIFIVGMPRSGTSLLEAMLAAHRNIFGAGDSSAYNAQLSTLREAVLNEMVKAPMDQDMQGVVEYQGNIVIRLLQESVDNDTTITPDKKNHIKYVTDKLKNNFRGIGLTHYVFPKAVIINVNRDPMDNLLSCYTHYFEDPKETPWALDQESLAFEYLNYLEVMDHYRTVLPGRIIDISYEQLVTSPKDVLKPLLQRLGLPWDDDVLQFHLFTNRTVPLASRLQVTSLV